MENIKLSICGKVCSQCPFRKDSFKGWLGDLTVDETLGHIFKEHYFSCHMTRGESPEDNLLKIIQGEQPICRGFMISATKSAKKFGGNLSTGKTLEALQDVIYITEKEKAEIMTVFEFKEYHSLKGEPKEV